MSERSSWLRSTRTTRPDSIGLVVSCDLALLGDRAQHLDDAGHEVGDVDVLDLGAQAGGLDLVEHQQVLDQAPQPGGVAVDDPQGGALRSP